MFLATVLLEQVQVMGSNPGLVLLPGEGESEVIEGHEGFLP